MQDSQNSQPDKYIKASKCVCGQKYVHVARYPESNGQKDITEAFARDKREGRIVEILNDDAKFNLCGESSCANAVGKKLTPLKEKEATTKDVLNFPVFKKQLLIFLKQEFDACQPFLDELTECETAHDIKRLARRNAEEIAEKLDADIECDECGIKDRRIRKLEVNASIMESEISDLEDKLEMETTKAIQSIPLDYKREAFYTHQDKYSFMDFEILMEKGHQLLPMIN